jgi:uncharacterized circularly permuted ATP-grasp superfamily protein
MATLPHVMLIYARLFYKARLNGVQRVDYVGWHCAKGSLVVNSSQGGGSKDFWVVADEMQS